MRIQAAGAGWDFFSVHPLGGCDAVVSEQPSPARYSPAKEVGFQGDRLNLGAGLIEISTFYASNIACRVSRRFFWRRSFCWTCLYYCAVWEWSECLAWQELSATM